jgi:hypothetical protein
LYFTRSASCSACSTTASLANCNGDLCFSHPIVALTITRMGLVLMANLLAARVFISLSSSVHTILALWKTCSSHCISCQNSLSSAIVLMASSSS